MGWPQNAYVGQEVIQVDVSESTNPWHRLKPLNPNTVYQILELHIGGPYGDLYFVVDDGTTRHWLARSFRPLTSRPTDISIFTAMLGPKQKETIDG